MKPSDPIVSPTTLQNTYQQPSCTWPCGAETLKEKASTPPSEPELGLLPLPASHRRWLGAFLTYAAAFPRREQRLVTGPDGPPVAVRAFSMRQASDTLTARQGFPWRAFFLTVPFQATVKSLSVERPVDAGMGAYPGVIYALSTDGLGRRGWYGLLCLR